mgnify:CR=1 FL=1
MENKHMGEIADLDDWVGGIENEAENGWASGFHTTRDGDELRLEDMTDDHLRNTIRFFKDKLDTTPLEEELASRYGNGSL